MTHKAKATTAFTSEGYYKKVPCPMEISIVKILSRLLLPPASFILFGLLGLGLARFRKTWGLGIVGMSLVGLLVCSLPVVSRTLMDTLQIYTPIAPHQLAQVAAEAEAVVLLAGGQRGLAEEFGVDTVNAASLERSRYAAWLVRRLNIPFIISGGRVHDEASSEAELMRALLHEEFALAHPTHIETQSRNTFENAQFTAALLQKNNIKKILLVTHAWHMPRAKSAFEHFSIQVIPAPTACYGRYATQSIQQFLPCAYALRYTELAFHELLGRWWYQLWYYSR